MSFIDQCRSLVGEYVALLVPEWKIDVETANLYPVLGECYPSWEYKGGLLRFHDLDRWPVDRPYDLELTVAHEVGHCVVAVLCTEPGTWQRRAEEWIVETFARALVALRRGLLRAPAVLVSEMRHLMATTVARRRTAGTKKGRYRMNISKETAQAALDAIAAGDTGPAVDVLKMILAEQLTGDSPTAEGEPPPLAAAEPEKDPNAPAFRAALAQEQHKRLDAERRSRLAAEETATLAEDTLRTALFDAQPAIFTSEVRQELALATPAEVKRFGAAAAKLRATVPAPAGRMRLAPGEPREPRPNGTGRPNNGGFADAED